jgi:hypothetical protein
MVVFIGMSMGIEVLFFLLILILVVVIGVGRGMILVLVIGLLKFLQPLVLRGFGGLLGNRGNLGLRWLPDGRAASLGPYNCRQNRFSSSSGFV